AICDFVARFLIQNHRIQPTVALLTGRPRSRFNPHFVEKSRATIGTGPVDPPTLAGRSYPEQRFHRSAACAVVERSSTVVKATCMPRLPKPEALAVEVMAKLVAESAEERAERGDL